MGACASAPKGMKDEERAAPPPEPLKEDVAATDLKVGDEVVNKAEGGGDDQKPEKVEIEKTAQETAAGDDPSKSLDTLLTDKKEGGAKEEAETEKKASEPETIPLDPKAEVVPIPAPKSNEPAAADAKDQIKKT